MAVTKPYSFFSYKAGNSFLHRCPAWVKILFIPLINILFLCLPFYFSVALIAIQFVLACVLRFTLKEQFTDLKPVFYYAAILVMMQILLWVFGDHAESFAMQFSWAAWRENVFLLIKILAVMQSASLMFKTSTSMQMREGIGKLFGQKSAITNALFMFLNFLPMVSKIWEQSKRAWIARGGKQNLKMYISLLPVLFSVGLKKAYNQARAISVRDI